MFVAARLTARSNTMQQKVSPCRQDPRKRLLLTPNPWTAPGTATCFLATTRPRLRAHPPPPTSAVSRTRPRNARRPPAPPARHAGARNCAPPASRWLQPANTTPAPVRSGPCGTRAAPARSASRSRLPSTRLWSSRLHALPPARPLLTRLRSASRMPAPALAGALP